VFSSKSAAQDFPYKIIVCSTSSARAVFERTLRGSNWETPVEDADLMRNENRVDALNHQLQAKGQASHPGYSFTTTTSENLIGLSELSVSCGISINEVEWRVMA
jgi:hypothetical protein